MSVDKAVKQRAVRQSRGILNFARGCQAHNKTSIVAHQCEITLEPAIRINQIRQPRCLVEIVQGSLAVFRVHRHAKSSVFSSQLSTDPPGAPAHPAARLRSAALLHETRADQNGNPTRCWPVRAIPESSSAQLCKPAPVPATRYSDRFR